MFQTNVQNLNGVRIGSGKLEAQAWPGSFVDMTNIGVLEGATMTLKRTVATITPDNSPEIPVRVTVTGATIEATLKEWTLDILELLGLGTVTETADTPVSGATTTILSGNWSYQQFIPVTSENSASITGVSAATNGPLVEDTDYIVVTTDAGVTGIIVLDSTTVTTESQNLTVTYGYTPVAAKEMKFGGGTAPTYISVKFTNTNPSGKQYYYKFYKAVLTGDFKHATTKDSDGEAAGVPITIQAYWDVTRDTGDEVMAIGDQQAV